MNPIPSRTPPNGSARRVAAFLAGMLLPSLTAAEIALASPGLPPSRVDDQGRLIEDWGALGFKVTGSGLPAPSPAALNATRLDERIPAAEVRRQHGALTCTWTVFRAPVWPAGLDVVTVRMDETGGRGLDCLLALDLPPTVRIGAKTVVHGGRPVIALPAAAQVSQETRDWGYHDDAVALPGWGHPEPQCDPAFRNIRAGLGGVPIAYRFKVEPKAPVNVVLGLCESHWSAPGQRPVVCQVEGAATQEADPVARWGQHQPGALLFAARDANGDGFLDLSVLPKPGAPDLNPILNVIWIFPSGPAPSLDRVILGQLNSQAMRYVDVGGEQDQSLHAGGRVEYALTLPPNGRQELTFLVACPGSSVPLPHQSAWTLDRLRRAAFDVWRDWR